MKTAVLIAGIAATCSDAWTYPDCEHDNCYRNLVDPRYAGEVGAFCIDWISGTTTDAGAIPTQYQNCPDTAPLSSACSCIAYTATITDCTTGTQESTSSPIITSSELEVTSSTPLPTTNLETITDCTTGAEVSASIVTSTIPVSTTICPITTTELSTGVSTNSPIESSLISTLWTTFSTSAQAVTECPATFPHCAGESTSNLISTILISTTVYPGTSDEASTSPQLATQAYPPPSASETHIPGLYVSDGLPIRSSTSAFQPSDCFEGDTQNRNCASFTLPSIQSSLAHTADTRPPMVTTSTLNPGLSSSSSPPVVSAGANRLGIEAIVFAGAAAALF
ncbi:hypothetical protein NLG97_g2318 [Lecanicillium saksenae]|uniref:Uncharacterized protein n=1 Tax=Lecanicillium saksenae TaxID=468837 RepID=A0ACC1R1B5_9HYPO|nr:hypothetical protein NLG97_g2318 [Lecanicillium saksenae]